MLPTHVLSARLHSAVDFLKSPLGAFLLAVAGIALAVYATWFNEKKTEVSVTLLVASNVLNDQAAVPSLEVRFQGSPLDPRKTPLKVALVRIWNSGDTTIRQADYDPKELLGFRIPSATLLWVGLDQSSSDYLSRNAVPKSSGGDTVTLPPVIFEPKDVVLVKVIAVQSQPGPLEVKPLGKVAGAASITERITVRHPAGYIEAFRTPTEDRIRRSFALFVLIAAFLNLFFVLIRDWRRKRKAQTQSPQREPTSGG